MGDGIVITLIALSLAALCYLFQRMNYNFFVSVGLTFMAAAFCPMFFLCLGIFFGSSPPRWLERLTDSSTIFWVGFLVSLPILLFTPLLKNSSNDKQ
jgi:hypothetical protein